MTPRLTLEIVFRDRRFAAMPASPLQVAICQGANGERVDLGDLGEHFGVDDLDGCERPQFVALVCGRGAGKSLLAACAAIAGALSADCRKLRVWDAIEVHWQRIQRGEAKAPEGVTLAGLG